MRKIFTMAAALLLFTLSAMAQTLKTPTLDDLMWGGSNYWNLQPRSVLTAWWGDQLVQNEVEQVWLRQTADGRTLPQPRLLFTLAELNAALPAEVKTAAVRSLTAARFPYADRTIAEVNNGERILHYDWVAKRLVWRADLPKGSSDLDFHADSRNAAYRLNDNLFVRTAEGVVHQLSTDGSRQLCYGTSVHRDEFGIHKGIFWSPQGDRLAFYRMDQSMVTDFPLIDIQVSEADRVAKLAPEAYPMAGMRSHKVSVGVFDLKTQRTVYLQTGDATDRYFTNIAFSPDGRWVYLYELPRSQDRADLVVYDAQTGARRGVLFTETNARYVEPQHPIVFLPWDAEKFVAWSQRDGFAHLYLHRASDGKLLRQLTKGEFVVMDHLGFNMAARSLIVRTNECGPLRANLYALTLDGRRTLLDNGVGMHNAQLSRGGGFLKDTWSDPQHYRVEQILRTKKPEVCATLLDAPSPWREYKMPQVELGSVTAADGRTPLYYRVVKPVDFDPTKKYPAVVYVYGGPHATNVKESWNYQARPWEYYMANRGYVIFVLDNRGSDHRGFAFESVIHRQLGQVEMADQMEGVKRLQSLPYVDTTRIGVHGWSFGGFMTTNLMLNHPEVFKVGVAGGPVLDWKYYEVMYGERYMDTPEENPEGYAAASMVAQAGKLKGRLQIIVGLNDPTCVLQHSLAFLRAAADAGVQPDYFVYPGQGHNMMGRDMVHLHERITRYFDDYLK